MDGMVALVTTTVTTSCGRGKFIMAGLLGYSLCVPLLDITVQQLSTLLDWYQFFAFPNIATL
jgi:hypothetical protein